jgi:hypothetical protein
MNLKDAISLYTGRVMIPLRACVDVMVSLPDVKLFLALAG